MGLESCDEVGKVYHCIHIARGRGRGGGWEGIGARRGGGGGGIWGGRSSQFCYFFWADPRLS